MAHTQVEGDMANCSPPPPRSRQEQEEMTVTEEASSHGVPESEAAAPCLSPDDLVARAIAPVKPEYLRQPPSSRLEAGGRRVGGEPEEKDTGNSSNTSTVVVKEKKSRRQLKRERKQEQKSALNICPAVAKTGSAKTCAYGDNCRFSHDLDAFLAQKPEDIEGTCPFLDAEEICPYGITCRFSKTHKANTLTESNITAKVRAEINGLSKDLQKLLWKNKVTFTKADTQLKLLGLKGGNNAKFNVDNVKCQPGSLDVSDNTHLDEINDNLENETHCTTETCTKNDSLLDGSVLEGTRPIKKAKSQVDKDEKLPEVHNGTIQRDEGPELLHAQSAPDKVSFDITCSSEVGLKPHIREKKPIDFKGKLYLAPLTTVGNLPFRRICKTLGADITCGEMAMCTNLLQGQASEWALLRRHKSEDLFGIQICGAYPDTISHTVELIERECTVDFIDINMGCPIDVVVNKGAGSALLTKPMRMKSVIQAASSTISLPLTVKVRTGYFEGRNRVDSLIPEIGSWGASALTIHGRSRQQRYSKLANWDYIYECARKAPDDLQVFGNGDIFSYYDWNKHTSDCPELSTCMIARGALIKPWIFTEIKEQRNWDISSGERFNIFKDFVQFGLEHWGSDTKGVETTRRFLLEWLSYTHRYIPVGLLERVPQRLNWRPPSYCGRDDLETLLSSDSAADWIRISEMLLGNVPEDFKFAPKHKSNAYDAAENG